MTSLSFSSAFPTLIAAVAVPLLLAGCPPVDTGTETATDPPIELIGPVITHTALEGPVDEGTPLTITAQIDDPDDGVFRAQVFFRTTDEPVFDSVLLLDDDGDGTFEATISGDRVRAPGFAYYLRAEDASEFRVPTFVPDAGRDAPLTLAVNVVGAPVPWSEDFEGAANAFTVFDLGWREISTGFAGSPWELTNARSASGDWAVVHRQGATDLPLLEDWLITPPLAVTGDGPYQLAWMERGQEVDLADHSLWYSVGEPDPSAGTFTEIAAVAPPEGASWRRSRVVEVPAEARGQDVYFAWRYVGQHTDTWYLDDAALTALGPDLQLSDSTHTRADPGTTAVVTVELTNGTRINASGVHLTATIDPTVGRFQGAADLDLAGNTSQSVDLLLDLLADAPDNTRVPIQLTATAGDSTWSWDQSVVIGDASVGHLAFDVLSDGVYQVVLGAGDPAAPSASVGVATGVLTAGHHELDVDLTEFSAQLPPGPGDHRWWAQLGGVDTIGLSQLQISYNGETFDGDDLGDVPANETQRFFLPAPPNPDIISLSWTPTPLSPGDSATLSVLLHNAGAPTTGTTTVSLTSRDPDVQVTTADPVLLDDVSWPADTLTTVTFPFDVLDSKTNARPAPLSLHVSDALEAWDRTLQVDVPWPLLSVQSIAIDDFDYGNDDGLLDPGERVLLDITLANVGTRATFAPAVCTLAPAGGAASADLIRAAGTFRTLDPNETDRDDRFEIALTQGVAGDDLRYAMTCNDGTVQYHADVNLTVGEAPWLSVSAVNDPVGDALGDADFDLVSGTYRVVNDTLQLRLVAAAPYNPATAFVEMWLQSPGADFTYYQVVAQSGAGSLRGFRFGFTPLNADPVVTNVDPTTLQVDVPLAPLGLAATRVEIGFAAGFCGGPTTFCDHFPDGWGDAFNAGLNTTVWLPLVW